MPGNVTAETAKKLIVQDGRRIGYETVFSVLNRMRLSSYMTKYIYIATNKHDKPVPESARIKVCRPRTEVTEDNFRYLQILDVICVFNEEYVDTPYKDNMLQKAIRNNIKDIEILFDLAKNYYPEVLDTVKGLMEKLSEDIEK